jgi:processive 1,2-diacylglycerol beta-glucosyltransferase
LKKILIFYGTYGGGHIAAARSIKNYLTEHYPSVDVDSIDCIEYISKSINKISTEAYKEMAKKTPHLWEQIYNKSNDGPLAKLSTTSNKIMAIKLKNLIKEEEPDLIISTHPFSSQMCAYLKKKGKINCKLATIMTDFHIHNQWLYLPEFVDYFFVSNEEMKQDMENETIDPNKIFVTGIPVSEKFSKDFNKEDICDEFWLDPDKFTILFFGGGEFGLGRDTAYMALKAIIRLLKDVQVVAISGKNKKMYKKFNELVDKTNSSDRIKVIEYTDKVPELMSIAGCVVTKAGGLTITESLTSHLPIFIINPIPGQEEENSEFLVNSGCAIWIKKDDNIARLLKNISRHPEKLEEMKTASILLAKPNATRDICEILLKSK